MPDANPHLDRMEITEAWTPLTAPVVCNSVEAVGSVNWDWCSNIEAADERNCFKAIAADVEEIIVEGMRVNGTRYGKNAIVCYVRAREGTGSLWLKLTA